MDHCRQAAGAGVVTSYIVTIYIYLGPSTRMLKRKRDQEPSAVRLGAPRLNNWNRLPFYTLMEKGKIAVNESKTLKERKRKNSPNFGN